MLNKKIVSWALYDLANTAFTSPFRTIFWPLLVTSILKGNEFHLGLTVAVSILIFSIIIPFLGAYSDSTNTRMPFIFIPTIFTIIIIAVLPAFNLFFNLVFAAVAIILYNISLSIYNSLLPEIASKAEMGKISGIGMGAGFFGTILSLALAYFVLKYFASNTIETTAGIKATFPAMAFFFLVFSLPLFLTIKDFKRKKSAFIPSKTFHKIKSTFKNRSRLKGMISFFISAAFFANAMAAIDVFFFLFAKKQIGISLSGFIFLFMVQSIGATFGAIVFGRLADKIGPKNILKIGGLVWVFVTLLLIVSKNLQIFWVAGVAGSIAFGSTFAASRALFVFLAPEKNIGEFFGYSQIVGKFTGLFGPVIAGWLIVKYNYNAALAVVLLFFVVSYIALLRIPDIRAKTAVKNTPV